jgi:hypothetical protein
LGRAKSPMEKKTPSMRRKIKISHNWTLSENRLCRRTRTVSKKDRSGMGILSTMADCANLMFAMMSGVVRRKFLRPLEKQHCKPDFLQPEIRIPKVKAHSAVVRSRRQDLFVIYRGAVIVLLFIQGIGSFKPIIDRRGASRCPMKNHGEKKTVTPLKVSRLS